jgi:phenylalanyl-tRNA synthetase beta chain
MFISLNWLNDFVSIPKSVTPDDLGLRLTMHTVEIDDVLKQSEKFKDVVVGRILEIQKHPNADRLQLAKVHVGEEELDIVCGAPNIEVGQLVPVATVGAVLPNGLEIKEAEVRGEKSRGMLCALDELGLGSDHAGIMILDKKAKIGQNFGEYLSMDDVIFEVDNKSITNRPDLWSHYGLAREVATFLDLKLNNKSKATVDDIKVTKEKVNIKIEDFDLCPRYMALKIDGIKIEDSPKWMQERLVAVGMRPINNIVDITNYVMLEIGQPMHAFDADFIKNIVVRRAKKDEQIVTLDGKKHDLGDEMLVIANEKDAVAVAGVMGGENSEVNSETTSIILESANFEHIQIRSTSQKLALRTDASMRFEKAIDPNLCETALARATQLILEICSDSTVASRIEDKKKYKLDQGPIDLDLNWLESYVGQRIDDDKVVDILARLGFLVEKNADILKVTVPTWRATKDITSAVDLSEEVMRIFGYNNIELVMPKVEIRSISEDKQRDLEKKIKSILVGSPAMNEVYNYSFVGVEQLKKLGVDSSAHLALKNPIANNQTLLRQSLSPNMLRNVVVNQARFEKLSFFEIGSIYLDLPGIMPKDDSTDEQLPYQEKHLSILAAGKNSLEVFSEIKGVVEHLFGGLRLKVDFLVSEMMPAYANKNIAAQISVANKNIGSVFVLDKKAAKKAGVKKEVALVEISINELLAVWGDTKEEYEAYEKYPTLERDLAFVVSEKNLYKDIQNEIFNYNEHIKKVELFDVYQGDKLDKGMKSLAFHVIYQASKTLTQKEVDELQVGLLKKMEERFEAKIRDF